MRKFTEQVNPHNRPDGVSLYCIVVRRGESVTDHSVYAVTAEDAFKVTEHAFGAFDGFEIIGGIFIG